MLKSIAGWVLTWASLAICSPGLPAEDKNQQHDGQKNQKDDGQRNQKDDGQQNQNDDTQVRRGAVGTRLAGRIAARPAPISALPNTDLVPGDKTGKPAVKAKRRMNQGAKGVRVTDLRAGAGQGRNDNGEKNQKDDGQRNQQDDGQKHQKDDGQKNQKGDE